MKNEAQAISEAGHIAESTEAPICTDMWLIWLIGTRKTNFDFRFNSQKAPLLSRKGAFYLISEISQTTVGFEPA